MYALNVSVFLFSGKTTWICVGEDSLKSMNGFVLM